MVKYEWDIETVNGDPFDENGNAADAPDILDHNHADQLAKFGDLAADERLCLVRDDGNGRAWAYVSKDGKIQLTLYDAMGNPVCDLPGRYYKEFCGSHFAHADWRT
jgi:hypothetical protein